MKNNLATDVYEHLMKKIKILFALLMACILLAVATNCAWATAYFKYKSGHVECLWHQEAAEVIIHDTSPNGKRRRST